MAKRKAIAHKPVDRPGLVKLDSPGGQYTVEAVNGLVPMPPPEVQQQLSLAQAHHLRWCETWGQEMPTVAGVEVCRAITYEMMQIFNKSLLQSG